jgi:hypothetical protein
MEQSMPHMRMEDYVSVFIFRRNKVERDATNLFTASEGDMFADLENETGL